MKDTLVQIAVPVLGIEGVHVAMPDGDETKLILQLIIALAGIVKFFWKKKREKQAAAEE